MTGTVMLEQHGQPLLASDLRMAVRRFDARGSAMTDTEVQDERR